MKKTSQRKEFKSSDEDVRQLVIARLKASSSGLKISIGGEGTFSKEDLIKRVEAGDEIGQKVIDIQMEYLRDLASGKIYQDEETPFTSQ